MNETTQPAAFNFLQQQDASKTSSGFTTTSGRTRRSSVGIREVDDQVWLVSFLQYDLGHLDRDQDRVEPGPNPVAPDKVLGGLKGSAKHSRISA